MKEDIGKHLIHLRYAQRFWQENPMDWMTYDEYWSKPAEERDLHDVAAVASIERKYLWWVELQILKDS